VATTTTKFGRSEVGKRCRRGGSTTPPSELVDQSTQFSILDIKAAGHPAPAGETDCRGMSIEPGLLRLPRLKHAYEDLPSVGQLDICGHDSEPTSACGEPTVGRSHLALPLRCDLPTVSLSARADLSSVHPLGIETVAPLHDRCDQSGHLKRTPQPTHRHVQSMLIGRVGKAGDQLFAGEH
jgi:hypothetical protein